MRTKYNSGEVEATRVEDWRGKQPYVALYAENVGDPQESVSAWLTPTEARTLAAELTRLADEIEGKE